VRQGDAWGESELLVVEIGVCEIKAKQLRLELKLNGAIYSMLNQV
jgi:hypothetical protein